MPKQLYEIGPRCPRSKSKKWRKKTAEVLHIRPSLKSLHSDKSLKFCIPARTAQHVCCTCAYRLLYKGEFAYYFSMRAPNTKHPRSSTLNQNTHILLGTAQEISYKPQRGTCPNTQSQFLRKIYNINIWFLTGNIPSVRWQIWHQAVFPCLDLMACLNAWCTSYFKLNDIWMFEYLFLFVALQKLYK